MKTAMEELIEYIEEWTAKNKTTDGIWSKAKSLLSKEKQQIIDARNDGYESTYNSCESGCMGSMIIEGSHEQYYNETYNNENTNNN